MQSTSIADHTDAKADGGQPPDRLREQLREMWGSVAGAWAQHAGYADARGAAVTERLLALTQPRPGERVLELACGPGSVGIAAAARVAPGGEVVVSDFAAEMTDIASRRARSLGLSNVRARVLDLEQIDEPDGAYDVVLCREGLMLVPDPARGAREMRRVLGNGGRLAIAVWGPRERNPWLAVMFDAVSAQLGRPVPPRGIPGPFSLQDADPLARLLCDAGLADVVVEELAVPLHAPSFDDWWRRASALAGPLARVLASLPAPAAEALRDRARKATEPFQTPRGLEFPGVALIAGARAP
jgi:SAM-dependent methyltransferase